MANNISIESPWQKKEPLNPLAWQMLPFVSPVCPNAMKAKTISLFLGLSALVCLTDARAVTIAENTAGNFDISNNVFGQSFTTSPGSPTSNIAFNFFSDVPATQIRNTFSTRMCLSAR
jgi:hypothetical protein